MTRDHWLFAACLSCSALSGLALLLLRNPRSFLSRLVDRLDGVDNPIGGPR